MSDQEYIAQVVLSYFEAGHMLTYRDYGRIAVWLKLTRERDTLLLILDELLPPYIAAAKLRRQPNLGGINLRVIRRLQDVGHATMTGGNLLA